MSNLCLKINDSKIRRVTCFGLRSIDLFQIDFFSILFFNNNNTREPLFVPVGGLRNCAATRRDEEGNPSSSPSSRVALIIIS